MVDDYPYIYYPRLTLLEFREVVHKKLAEFLDVYYLNSFDYFIPTNITLNDSSKLHADYYLYKDSLSYAMRICTPLICVN